MKFFAALLPLVFVHQGLFAQGDRLIPHNSRNESLRYEVQHAIDKGLKWLEGKQNADSYWDSPDHPAITGLVLTAMQRDPSRGYKDAESVKKGYAYLLGCVQPDGGIYKRDEINGNTLLCVMALLAANDLKYDPVLVKARQFLVGQQITAKSGKKNPYAGGIGYDNNNDPRPDMMHTVVALETLRALERLRGSSKPASKEKNPDWQAAIDFMQRCQNLSGFNKAKWVSDDPKDRGGFVTTPVMSAAVMPPRADGRELLRSYGSATYAGLLGYICAGVKRDDPRITAVIEWAGRNYSLEENPAMGREGLYHYYHMLAKALAVYGLDKLKLADGREADWKNDLAKKLINLQHDEGFWVNDNESSWEKNPVVVTAYSVLALEYVYQAQ